jgi:hypothetical protein
VDKQLPVRPWQLSGGIDSLAAQARISGTDRLIARRDTRWRSESLSLARLSLMGPEPLIGPGTFLVAAYLHSGLRGGKGR